MESSTLEQPQSTVPAEWPSIADQLQRMAQWFMDHPEAQADTMSASTGKHTRLPKIVFHHVETMAAAFPGATATKKRFQDCFVYMIRRDGIDFEAWDRPEDAFGTESEVIL